MNQNQPKPAGRKGYFFQSPALVTLFAILFLGEGIPAYGLVIQATFDSSITSDPNAATIENTINSAIQIYQTEFSDPITVTIEFKEMPTGLGRSQYTYYTIQYSEFYSALQADAKTANDAIALANLPSGPDNPVTGDTTFNINTANLKAIGIMGMSSDLPGGYDGIVSLNVSIMNLTRPPGSLLKYDLMAVAEHEIDEVLGFGSRLPTLPSNDEPFPEDLFRYDSSGNRNFTTNGDDAYFSLDGTNLLARFNQDSSGDYGDWWSTGSHTPQVQDAFATAGATPNLGVELTALDVIGYDLAPTLAIIPAGAGQATISWTPGTTGYVLQESASLSPASWVNSSSGTNNPATIFTTSSSKFYRLSYP